MLALLVDSVVVVVASVTTSLTVFEVEVTSRVSPEYCAERLCVPVLKVVVEKLAVPLELNVTLPITVFPS